MIQNILTENPQIQSTKRIIAKKTVCPRAWSQLPIWGRGSPPSGDLQRELQKHDGTQREVSGAAPSNTFSFVGDIALSCIFFFFFMIGLHTRFEAGVETWTRKVKLK